MYIYIFIYIDIYIYIYIYVVAYIYESWHTFPWHGPPTNVSRHTQQGPSSVPDCIRCLYLRQVGMCTCIYGSWRTRECHVEDDCVCCLHIPMLTCLWIHTSCVISYPYMSHFARANAVAHVWKSHGTRSVMTHHVNAMTEYVQKSPTYPQKSPIYPQKLVMAHDVNATTMHIRKKALLIRKRALFIRKSPRYISRISSWHTISVQYVRVMPLSARNFAHVNLQLYTCEFTILHMWIYTCMGHVTYMNESRVMSHIWMSHGTLVKESSVPMWMSHRCKRALLIRERALFIRKSPPTDIDSHDTFVMESSVPIISFLFLLRIFALKGRCNHNMYRHIRRSIQIEWIYLIRMH